MEVIHLPPANGLNGRYLTKQGHYDAYKIWRKSAGYNLWLRSQWRIQKGKCFYCKTSLKGRAHNVEHIVNQARWGETVGSNMVLSCPPCNKDKGSTKASKELIRHARLYNHNKRQTKRSKKLR